jgi:hypothetical protein
LLAKILSEHSQVKVPDETGLLFKFLGFSRKYRVPGKTKHYQQLYQADDDAIKQLLHHQRHIHNLDDLLAYFSSYYAHAYAKPCIGEKTPNNWYFFERLQKKTAQSKLLFIIRNPYSAVNSYKKYQQPWFPFRRTPKVARLRTVLPTLVWLKAFRHFERVKKDHRTKLVYYEALTHDPELTMRSVCNFLGLSFEADMLLFYKNPAVKDKVGRSNDYQAPRENLTQSVSSEFAVNTDHLDRKDIQLINFIARQTMDQNNYKRDCNERLHFTTYLIFGFHYGIGILFYQYKMVLGLLQDLMHIIGSKLRQLFNVPKPAA